MKLLLLGAGGQLGRELQQTLAPLGHVEAWGRSQLDLACVDRASQSAVRAAIVRAAPEVVVNAAAYTAVDRAEREPELARAVNALAPQAMAEAADELGALLLHVSTDYVFAGDSCRPYRETDSPRPLGMYGESKWQGEEAVRSLCQRHCIVRTAWLYGAAGNTNFVKTMLRLGQERERIDVVCDRIGSPTWARDLAEALACCIPQWMAPKNDADAFGTYHYSNSGVASWYDFAVAIFEEARNFVPLTIEQVRPISSADYPTPAQRPQYSVLDTTRIARLLTEPLPHWRASLRRMLVTWLADSVPPRAETPR